MIATTLRRAVCCAALLAGLAVAPAFAQQRNTGLYIQGGYTYLNFEAGDTGYEVDSNAVTARLGWQLSPGFGLEAELTGGLDDDNFDFDSNEDDINFDGNNDGNFDDIVNLSGDIGVDFIAAAYGRLTFPLSSNLELGLRGGYAYTQVDANSTALPGGNFTIAEGEEDGFTAGASLGLILARNLELRADYTWFGFDDVETQAATIAVGLTF